MSNKTLKTNTNSLVATVPNSADAKAIHKHFSKNGGGMVSGVVIDSYENASIEALSEEMISYQLDLLVDNAIFNDFDAFMDEINLSGVSEDYYEIDEEIPSLEIEVHTNSGSSLSSEVKDFLKNLQDLIKHTQAMISKKNIG